MVSTMLSTARSGNVERSATRTVSRTVGVSDFVFMAWKRSGVQESGGGLLGGVHGEWLLKFELQQGAWADRDGLAASDSRSHGTDGGAFAGAFSAIGDGADGCSGGG